MHIKAWFSNATNIVLCGTATGVLVTCSLTGILIWKYFGSADASLRNQIKTVSVLTDLETALTASSKAVTVSSDINKKTTAVLSDNTEALKAMKDGFGDLVKSVNTSKEGVDKFSKIVSDKGLITEKMAVESDKSTSTGNAKILEELALIRTSIKNGPLESAPIAITGKTVAVNAVADTPDSQLPVTPETLPYKGRSAVWSPKIEVIETLERNELSKDTYSIKEINQAKVFPSNTEGIVARCFQGWSQYVDVAVPKFGNYSLPRDTEKVKFYCTKGTMLVYRQK